MLTSNGYLRLDPNVLHFAVYSAGMLLARQGKPEVQDCIAGLRQYGYAYEEAFDQATEMEKAYSQAVGGIFPIDARFPANEDYPQFGRGLDFSIPQFPF